MDLVEYYHWSTRNVYLSLSYLDLSQLKSPF